MKSDNWLEHSDTFWTDVKNLKKYMTFS